MRWASFAILVYVVLLVQTTVGRLLTFNGTSMGSVGPDLAAIAAVFVALRLRDGTEVAISAWLLGLAVDLATGGGVGEVTAVGPMAIGYTLAVAAIFRLREMFFRERPATQALLALVFCVMAHFTWVSLQLIFGAAVQRSWAGYGRLMLEAMALACYTAVLAPAGYWALSKAERLLIVPQAGRARRGGMGR
jgi:rod shape-determining protein MreD